MQAQFSYNTYHHMTPTNSIWPLPTSHWPVDSWDRHVSNISLLKKFPENDIQPIVSPSKDKKIKDSHSNKEKEREGKSKDKKISTINNSKNKEESTEGDSKTLDLDTR